MVQTAVTISAPLGPQVMHLAGVPLDDALWYARIPSGRHKVKALRHPRGERILKHVREFMQQATARDAMPMTA
jgi:hypothetical protein